MEAGLSEDTVTVHSFFTHHVGQEGFLIVAFLALVSVYWFKNAPPAKSHERLPPGSFGWPVIGETVEFLADGRVYNRVRRARYGPIFRTHLFNKPFVVVCGIQNVRKLLKLDIDSIEISPPLSIQRLFGSGVVTCTGFDHKRWRNILGVALSHDNVRSFTAITQKITKEFLEEWCTKPQILASEECRRLTLALGLKFLMDLDFQDAEFDVWRKYWTMYDKAFFAIPVDFPGFTMHKGLHARKELLNLIEKASRKEVTGDCPSVLHLMMSKLQEDADTQGNGKIPQEDLNATFDNILSLLFGAESSIASSMCTILLQLVKNPDILRDIRLEIEEQAPSADMVTYAEVGAVSRVADLVKEALRHTPPVAGYFRTARQELQIGDYTIPEGWGVLTSITDTHEMNFKGDDYNKFDPSRWRDSKTFNNLDSLPFGGGRRICPGREYGNLCLHILAIEAARSCDWRMLGDVNPQYNTAPIPFPKDGLPLKFSKLD